MASPVKKSELGDFFKEAQSWDQERIRTAYRSRNTAWIVAGVASVAAIAGVGAVAALSPLKTVQPFVVTVDRNTGSTEVTTALTGQKNIPYEEAVTKYFVGRYVRLREGWIPRARKESFQTIGIMSTPDEQRRWGAFYRIDNPRSPQNLYAEGSFVDVELNSITFVNDEVAQVRFVKLETRGNATKRTNWIATLSFSYSPAPRSEGDRLMNPLGFQVATYRADPEVVSSAPTAVANAAAEAQSGYAQ